MKSSLAHAFLLALLCTILPRHAAAQGTGLANFSVETAAFEKVIQGDPALLSKLAGNVLVVGVLPNYVDIHFGKEPPPDWKGSKDDWAKELRRTKATVQSVQGSLERWTKQFTSLQRRFDGKALFFGFIPPNADPQRLLSMAEAIGFMPSIVQVGKSWKLPRAGIYDVVIFGQNGHVFHVGPINDEAEKVLKNLLAK